MDKCTVHLESYIFQVKVTENKKYKMQAFTLPGEKKEKKVDNE